MKTEPSSVNYIIIHFAKFCQLSDQMNNWSKEVLQFYMELYLMLKES
jgi:hypothetical protein